MRAARRWLPPDCAEVAGKGAATGKRGFGRRRNNAVTLLSSRKGQMDQGDARWGGRYGSGLASQRNSDLERAGADRPVALGTLGA